MEPQEKTSKNTLQKKLVKFCRPFITKMDTGE